MTAECDRPILLTGASGTLGRLLVPLLASRYGSLLMTDIVEFPNALPPGVEFVRTDLSDGPTFLRLARRAGTIVHFAGIGTEQAFEAILAANIVGATHVFEAARQTGARVVFASTNHTIGFYPRGQALTMADPGRPDGFYGLSKLYGEMLGQLYFDKHGVESVHLRIGSCLARPTEPRHLSTWLSYGDLARLVHAGVDAAHPGVAAVWGVSANTRSWWHGGDAARIGYFPADNAEDFADSVRAPVEDPVAARYQGANFCAKGYTRPLEDLPRETGPSE
ncbi:MAG TPA: NAD(P)-dependent oxidoreductase [Aliidongia sp.]|uniref:NAD-dependent epimerase/dehydratase family protein n=1 Tax=Aliidongia sp. TaxID=1914230 RepID=UPI002DDD8101|nr:NAD(P)-dependent oxidoreductase [Aliidongia sp.]HEV2675386.1 NAD(P)-dependent oxidoreductase [Aliidongia sp.]